MDIGHKCPKNTNRELEPTMAAIEWQEEKGGLEHFLDILGISKKVQLGGNRWFSAGRNIFLYRSPS